MSCHSSHLDSSGVWNRDGIYYTAVALHGTELPLEIALHGVRSESEAQEAMALIAHPRCLILRAGN